jgi:hypothetical protein
MSTDCEAELEKGNEPERNSPTSPNAPEESRPEGVTNSAGAHFRQGFLTEARYGVLMALGEEPREYVRMMESLVEDLQPRPGLESHLAEQMGETFWRMLRVQRMRDGLALKNIRNKVQGEEMVAMNQAAKSFDALEPFERLKKALARPGAGPTAAEIEAFVKARKGDTSEEMQEFIRLLKSLHEPMEEVERKAARRNARKQLGQRMEAYENVAWRFSRQLENAQSPENLAALMAPEDQSSVHLQRMEDSNLRRLWRLINAFGKIRQGVLEKKDVKKIRTKP